MTCMAVRIAPTNLNIISIGGVMLGQASGGVFSTVAGFLSWMAREHCMRNPDAVCKAWEALVPDAPTLADAGRMLSAYGVDFSVAELRYIAGHPEALLLARAAASGASYLKFSVDAGYAPNEDFVPPSSKHISRAAWLLIILLAGSLGWAFYQGATGSLQAGAVYLAVSAVLFLMNILEVVDMRGKERARQAIELCKRWPQSDKEQKWIMQGDNGPERPVATPVGDRTIA